MIEVACARYGVLLESLNPFFVHADEFIESTTNKAGSGGADDGACGADERGTQMKAAINGTAHRAKKKAQEKPAAKKKAEEEAAATKKAEVERAGQEYKAEEERNQVEDGAKTTTIKQKICDVEEIVGARSSEAGVPLMSHSSVNAVLKKRSDAET